MNERHPPQPQRVKCMFGMVMACTAILASSQAAAAASSVLVCNNEAGNGQITIDLDASASTATINYPAGTTPTNPPVNFAARSVGPLAARFEPRSITFDNQTTAYVGAPTIYEHYIADRVTGALLDYYSAYAPWDQSEPKMRIIYKFSCHVGTTQF